MFEKELSKSLGAFTSRLFKDSVEFEFEVDVEVAEVDEKALGDVLLVVIDVEEDRDSGDNMESELEFMSKMFAKSLLASLDRFEGGK